MNCLQPAMFDVRVNLSRRDVGMAQQFLQGADFRTASEHVSCKAMPQRVRADLTATTGASGILFHELPNHDSSQPRSSPSDE